MEADKDRDTANQHIALQQPYPQDIHAVLRELTAALAEQRVKIAFLEKENQDHVTKLKELEKKEIETDKKVEQLQVKQVAFSASLLDQGHGDIGPFNTQITLIFKHVVTNIGNAYNPHTGMEIEEELTSLLPALDREKIICIVEHLMDVIGVQQKKWQQTREPE
ncbi:uncharacterized protein LOC112847975 isoform X2 [Oreochromis niloticus]|uniref:uncharacterized protein LOC112847975 isoform X2 n=1 Tax=Oreochromis niloticus TaxID=8128 RepID=UPI000DF2E8AC|nr:uncharacterized protein LOC112847975 isoform X2 [Oreochromis niloticus]